jgi:hypothetical protein
MKRYPSLDTSSEPRAAPPPLEALLPAAGAGTALWLMLAVLLLAV